MRGERALITGGAGAVGSNIADQLVRAGAEEIVVLDNFVRGRRENLAWALGQRPRAVGRGRHPRPRARRRADARHRRRLPPGGAADHAVRRGTAPGARGDGRRHLQRDRGRARSEGVRRVVAASSASVYGLAERVPHRRDPPPLRQRHALRRRQDVQRGPAAQLPRDARSSTTSRCATSTSTARGWTSTASTPRCSCAGWSGSRPANSPLILGDGSQTMDFVYIEDVARANLLAAAADVTDEVFNVASGDGDEPARARPAADRGDGLRRVGRVRPRAVGQQGPAPTRRHDARARAARLRGRGRPRRGPAAARRVVARRTRRRHRAGALAAAS